MAYDDATMDPRFAGSRLVVDDPHLRFYAAAPLVTPDDHAIGTVCVIDCEPRRLDEHQRVAIDDFGTGYSSLAYLKSLPIDRLKIDRSFVASLGHDPYGSAIVHAVASIGRALELDIVAEGVETVEQAEHALAHGCEVAQGYLFGAAVPGPDLAARLAPGGDEPAVS